MINSQVYECKFPVFVISSREFECKTRRIRHELARIQVLTPRIRQEIASIRVETRRIPVKFASIRVKYPEFFTNAQVIAPAGFWPLDQNPRRHSRIPRVYKYKDKEDLLKK